MAVCSRKSCDSGEERVPYTAKYSFYTGKWINLRLPNLGRREPMAKIHHTAAQGFAAGGPTTLRAVRNIRLKSKYG